MSNPSRAKGTGFENVVLARLRRVFGPGVSRSAAGTESNDFHGVPFPVEAKKRKTLAVPDWVRRIRKVAALASSDNYVPGKSGWHVEGPWAIFVCDGDKRRSGSFGELMIVDANFGEELLLCWNDENGPGWKFRVDEEIRRNVHGGP